MSSHTLRRSAVLLLIAVLLTPLASAANPRAETASPAAAVEPLELLSRLWSLLVRSKEGCNIDPNGRCKEGCNIDPSGRCAPQPASQPDGALQTKEGCHIDPNGRCLP
jgi:hypothetical protein